MHQAPISRPVAGSGIVCRFRQPAPALDLAFIVLVACPAMKAFWQPGVSSPVDMLIGIYRIFELAQSWRVSLSVSRLSSILRDRRSRCTLLPILHMFRRNWVVPGSAGQRSSIPHRAGSVA